jgi:acyl-CoA reductase-like NAD-dependent aldehyde dehydrogenase
MTDPQQSPDIDDVVRLVLGEITKRGSHSPAMPHSANITSEPLTETPPTIKRSTQDGHCLFNDMDEAVSAARQAQRRFLDISMEQRLKIVANIRKRSLEEAERIARMEIGETALGKFSDKILKIVLCANKTPGPEDLQSHAVTGDHGLTLTELAPWGVVASITPTTNPPATVLNNAISVLSAGNGIVFNPHPSAKMVSAEMSRVIHDAVVEAGGPASLITCIASPTIESAQALMKHKNVDLVVVTGGGAVVRQAMASGKRAICAGPGNPPVVVDETAIISQAAKDIVNGAGYDYNILCTCEKEIFAVDKIAHKLKRDMVANGAYEIEGTAIDKLTKLLVESDPDRSGYRHVAINRRFVGKSPEEILRQIDITPPPGTKIVFFEAPWDHPLVMAEQLMPVIPFVRCKSVEEAMEKAVIVEHQFRHTFVMHSTSIVNLSNMAQLCRANIFVKNGMNLAGLGYGGEGWTTMSIAGTTGEGLTKASTFTRPRRCTLVDYFRII